MFIVSAIVVLGSLDGRKHFIDGLDGVGEHLKTTQEHFQNLESDVDQFKLNAQEFSEEAKKPCKSDDSKSVLQTISDEFKKSEEELANGVGSISEDIGKMGDTLKDGKDIIDALVIAIVIVFVLISLLGLISVGLGGKAGNAVLTFTSVMAIIVLLAMIGLQTVQVTTSVALADFCYEGPLNNMEKVADQHLTDRTQALFKYYLTCNGGETASPIYDDIVEATDMAGQVVMVAKQFAKTGQCEVERAVEVGESTLATIKTMSRIISCDKTINPILVGLTQDALCGDAVSGLYIMWTTQTAACFLLWFTLIYAQFARGYWTETEADLKQRKKKKSVPVQKYAAPPPQAAAGQMYSQPAPQYMGPGVVAGAGGAPLYAPAGVPQGGYGYAPYAAQPPMAPSYMGPGSVNYAVQQQPIGHGHISRNLA